MSWGGARVGAGQKPSERHAKKRRKDPIVPMRMLESGTSLSSGAISALPPEDVPANQRDFWQRCAPLAVTQGTLTPQTVEAFRLLCELDAEKRLTKATIERDGRTFIKITVDGAGVEHQELKAHPLTGAYGRLCKAVEALMARFKLAPFGKAELPTKSKQAAQSNPWAKVAGQA